MTLIDPDDVIRREGLGSALRSPAGLSAAVRDLLEDGAAWQAASWRCRSYMEREYGEDQVLSSYVDTFQRLAPLSATRSGVAVASEARHA